MRAVLQRVDGARVLVNGTTVGEIDGPGILAMVGVTHDDDGNRARRLAAKIYDLRIFDAASLTERGLPLPGDAKEVSASDAELPILVVSQFTLYGDARKGRRPTWDAAAPAPIAEPLVNEVVSELRRRGATVATGDFGADMRVELTNDGPITVLLEV